eukprot:1590969-Prymnesium_polylepis.1
MSAFPHLGMHPPSDDLPRKHKVVGRVDHDDLGGHVWIEGLVFLGDAIDELPRPEVEHAEAHPGHVNDHQPLLHSARTIELEVLLPYLGAGAALGTGVGARRRLAGEREG